MLYLLFWPLCHRLRLRTLYPIMQITRSTGWLTFLKRKDIIRLFSMARQTDQWDLIHLQKWLALMIILVLINILINLILMASGEYGMNRFYFFLLLSLIALNSHS